MNYFIGVDVQTARGCPFAVLNEDANVIDDGWIAQAAPEQVVASLREIARRYRVDENIIALAVDAPRTPLAAPRQWYWRVTDGGSANRKIRVPGVIAKS